MEKLLHRRGDRGRAARLQPADPRARRAGADHVHRADVRAGPARLAAPPRRDRADAGAAPRVRRRPVVVPCIPDEEHQEQLTRDEITASVHYIHFRLDPSQVEAFADRTGRPGAHPSEATSTPPPSGPTRWPSCWPTSGPDASGRAVAGTPGIGRTVSLRSVRSITTCRGSDSLCTLRSMVATKSETERQRLVDELIDGRVADTLGGRLLRTREVALLFEVLRASGHRLGDQGSDPEHPDARWSPPLPGRRRGGPARRRGSHRLTHAACCVLCRAAAGANLAPPAAAGAPGPPCPAERAWTTAGAHEPRATASTRGSSSRQRTRTPDAAKAICDRCAVRGAVPGVRARRARAGGRLGRLHRARATPASSAVVGGRPPR